MGKGYGERANYYRAEPPGSLQCTLGQNFIPGLGSAGELARWHTNGGGRMPSA